MHALRHACGSVLLDAGETIEALAEYLGHPDAGFTLRTSMHLMPSSESRTRRAIDLALAPEVHTATDASQTECTHRTLAA